MAKESLSRYALARWGMQPNTSRDAFSVSFHQSSDGTYYTIFIVTLWLRLRLTTRRVSAFPLTQVGEEIHLEGIGQFRSGPERKVDVLVQHFRNIWTRDLHALGKLGLRHPELLHAEENAAKERGADMVNCGHGVYLTM